MGEGTPIPRLRSPAGPWESPSLSSGFFPLYKTGPTEARTSQEGQQVPLQEAQPENPHESRDPAQSASPVPRTALGA